ncbi:hypothetical protein F5Y15DRAFT_413707 [Xylariaceae sp. FL0016]|nr:hypothetical protein F5Y15DRAFT_413707 [Xylariaceae sp. FL0016]
MATNSSSPEQTQESEATTTSPSSESQTQTGSEPQKPLPLPASSSSSSSNPPSLHVGGEGIKLDHLGPLVVNEDGTMSRIANWGEMAEVERENTLRILGKRNKLRLARLRGENKD